jgi:hypothetical protein
MTLKPARLFWKRKPATKVKVSKKTYNRKNKKTLDKAR